MAAKAKLVSPDGGWGWMIVLASGMAHFVSVTVVLNYGLIFRDIFETMGLSHKDSSIILNANSAFGMITGMLNGALLKYFGYRKVAVSAGIILTSGLILTSFSNTFLQYFFFYGCFTSFGFGLILSSNLLAVNTYFVEKKGKATSLAMTITGLGPVVMPLLISYLMSQYPASSVILILSGICAHSIAAALLLQPVKWHLKKVLEDDPEVQTLVEYSSNQKDLTRKISLPNPPRQHQNEMSIKQRIRSNSIAESTNSIDHDRDAGSIYGFDTALSGSVLSLKQGRNRNLNRSISEQLVVNKWWSSTSINSNQVPKRSFNKQLAEIPLEESENNEDEETKRNPLSRRILKTIVNSLDLTLLCDPIYVNIMIGMSLAIFAEINFSILTPFIFADFGLTLQQNATCMSVVAVADIIFRFFAPFIGDFLKQPPPRLMYMFSLVLLIITRFSILFVNSYTQLLWVAVGLGTARGVRTVYLNLVIPSYVPIERLASASGMQMMLNGICIMTGGPILGFIRDKTGSYNVCICIINCITTTCILTWTTEMVCIKIKQYMQNKAQGQS